MKDKLRKIRVGGERQWIEERFLNNQEGSCGTYKKAFSQSWKCWTKRCTVVKFFLEIIWFGFFFNWKNFV